MCSGLTRGGMRSRSLSPLRFSNALASEIRGDSRRVGGHSVRLDSVWMANYEAYKEGLEDMPHRC